MDDIFMQFGDIFGGGFRSFFGGGGGRGSRVQKGSNLGIALALTLEEIAVGAEKRVKLKHSVSCQHCNGTGAKNGSALETCHRCNGQGRVAQVVNSFFGQMQSVAECPECGGSGKRIKDTCPNCKGQGLTQVEDIVTVKIPAGVEDGMKISVPGQGNACRNGGVNGDLIVTIREVQHEKFTRDGSNLIYHLYLSLPEVLLGAQIEVPTIDGKVRVTIDPGTQPGKVLRLKGKGLPDLNYGQCGDLLVRVDVFIPKNISKDDKKLVEQLSRSDAFKPTAQDRVSFMQKMRNMFS